MKKINLAICLVLIASVLMPFTSTQAAENGVDDLRGRWDIEAYFSEGEPVPDIVLYVNEMRASALLANTYYANGCMRSTDTNAFMPLSIRAIYDPQTNTYDVAIYSTVIPPEGGPFVIRFTGVVNVYGESVKDDRADGELRTDFSPGGEWNAVHHDRRITKCPSIRDIGLGAQGDVYTHLDLGNNHISTVYETYTIIVSSGMLIEAPDGSTVIAQEYTDIFSPDVDFVGRFRFVLDKEGQPISSGVYKFTLLDIFGDPIPGTESTDVWMGCSQGAPVNLTAAYEPGSGVTLGWDAVPDVAGEFEPGLGIGFYQIGIDPFNWQGMHGYGSNLIQTPLHLIPWNPFEPGSDGNPNGFDYGVSLFEFADGNYAVNVYAFANPNPQNGGTGLECDVMDSSHKLVMTKQGDNLTFNRTGTISGHVFDAQGNPLGGIGVDTEFGGYGTCTDEDGFYMLRDMPLGTYNITAGRQFCGEHPFMEQMQMDVQVDTENVNFILEKAPVPTDYTIIAHPDHEWVTSFGWAVGTDITMYIDNNADLGDGYLLDMTLSASPADWDPSIGKVDFSSWQPFDLTPGLFVTVTDGVNTETLWVESLSINQFDEVTNTVTGTAPALNEVGVGAHQPDADFWMIVTSDPSGNWTAEFPDDLAGVLDIHAMVWDGNGDATQANYLFP
jgi:hypothetical protein